VTQETETDSDLGSRGFQFGMHDEQGMVWMTCPFFLIWGYAGMIQPEVGRFYELCHSSNWYCPIDS